MIRIASRLADGVPNVCDPHLEHVRWSLTGEVCQIHGIARRPISGVPNCPVCVVLDVYVATALGEAFYAGARIRGRRIAPFACLVEDVWEECLFSIGTHWRILAQVPILANVLRS